MGTVTRLPKGESAVRGEEIYERDIRHLVEAEHRGRVMAIDVDTGRWEIADDTLTAARRLRDGRPEVVNVFLMRVGHRALYSFGGQPTAITE